MQVWGKNEAGPGNRVGKKNEGVLKKQGVRQTKGKSSDLPL